MTHAESELARTFKKILNFEEKTALLRKYAEFLSEDIVTSAGQGGQIDLEDEIENGAGEDKAPKTRAPRSKKR